MRKTGILRETILLAKVVKTLSVTAPLSIWICANKVLKDIACKTDRYHNSFFPDTLTSGIDGGGTLINFFE